MSAFAPFKDEASVLALEGLTIENRIDRIEVYGNAQITRDKAGLALARELKQLLDAIVGSLEAEALPERIMEKPPEKVRNPFD